MNRQVISITHNFLTKSALNWKLLETQSCQNKQFFARTLCFVVHFNHFLVKSDFHNPTICFHWRIVKPKLLYQHNLVFAVSIKHLWFRDKLFAQYKMHLIILLLTFTTSMYHHQCADMFGFDTLGGISYDWVSLDYAIENAHKRPTIIVFHRQHTPNSMKFRRSVSTPDHL